MTKDNITKRILRILNSSDAPLETKEIHEKINIEIGEVSRSKLMYRLNNLRAEREIQGKYVGSGKGVWIWWKSEVLE
jgi:DNA-binding Lrp family transcriptional regulator